MYFKKVNGFKTRLIKAKGAFKLPTYKTTGDDSFLFGLVGGIRNAGKSNTTLVLLENEKDIVLSGEAKVYFVSPTVDAKVKGFAEKYPDNFEIYDELNRSNLTDIFDEMKNRIDEWQELKDVIDIYHRAEKGEELQPPEEELLITYNFLDGFDFKAFNHDHPPTNTLVIDDSMSSPMLSSPQSKDGKWFIKFACKHRHYPYMTNLIFLTQHIKQISRVLRVNCNLVVVFPFRDASIYHSVFQEYSTLFKNKIDNFLDLMENIEARNNHSHATIYYDKKRFVRVGWDEEVRFGDDDAIPCSCDAIAVPATGS